MIEFMLIAAPRSGTTWAANWLTTDQTLCLHDPLWEHHYRNLDLIESEKRLGISCSGIALFPEWVNGHPARKVILHRDHREINRSLSRIGLPAMGRAWDGALEQIRGRHYHWDQLFGNAKPIYEYLLDAPFDTERHAQLRHMRIEPEFQTVPINRAVTRRLLQELAASAQ